MLIKDLPKQEGARVHGAFRTLPSELIKANGVGKFLRFGLRDVTGNVRAHGWKERYHGPDHIEKNSKILLKGSLRQYKGHWIVDAETVEVVAGPEKNPLLRPESVPCPVPGAMERLYEAIEDLTIASLRSFAFSALALPGILQPFLLAPASAANHHRYPGGLVQHSLECMDSVRSQPGFELAETELGIVAALFHDIGKIRTMRADMRFSGEAFMLDHDDLTLEILAPCLKELDNLWPQGANDLRYIWSFLNAKKGRTIPRITVADAVVAADRISAGLDNQRSAFSSHPRWHRHGSFAGRYYTRTLIRNRHQG